VLKGGDHPAKRCEPMIITSKERVWSLPRKWPNYACVQVRANDDDDDDDGSNDGSDLVQAGDHHWLNRAVTIPPLLLLRGIH
jgi:hypothetical protein